jgi:hypothetical protein
VQRAGSPERITGRERHAPALRAGYQTTCERASGRGDQASDLWRRKTDPAQATRGFAKRRTVIDTQAQLFKGSCMEYRGFTPVRKRHGGQMWGYNNTRSSLHGPSSSRQFVSFFAAVNRCIIHWRGSQPFPKPDSRSSSDWRLS